MKSSELILENIETNRKLIEELNSKIESLIEMKDPKKKKKNNPKSKEAIPKRNVVKNDDDIDELIEFFKDKQEEAKEEKTIYKLENELESEPRKEKTIKELVAELDLDKGEIEKPKPKIITPLPSK